MSAELFDFPDSSRTPLGALTIRAGLLHKAAETNRQLAQATLESLDTAMRALEPSVRDAVRQAVAQTVQAEIAQLRGELQRTNLAMQTVHTGLRWKVGLLACAIGVTTAVMAVSGIRLLGGITKVGHATELATAGGLTGDPAVLAEIARRGLMFDVTFCEGDASGGNQAKNRLLCVKVDPNAGFYGPNKDYMMVLEP